MSKLQCCRRKKPVPRTVPLFHPLYQRALALAFILERSGNRKFHPKLLQKGRPGRLAMILIAPHQRRQGLLHPVSAPRTHLGSVRGRQSHPFRPCFFKLQHPVKLRLSCQLSETLTSLLEIKLSFRISWTLCCGSTTAPVIVLTFSNQIR